MDEHMDEQPEHDSLGPETMNMINEVNAILLEAGAKEFVQRYLDDNIKLWHSYGDRFPSDESDKSIQNELEAETEFQQEMDYLRDFINADLPFVVESFQENPTPGFSNSSRLHLRLARVNADGTLFKEGAIPDLILIEPLTFKDVNSVSNGDIELPLLFDLDGTHPDHSGVLEHVDEGLATGLIKAFEKQEGLGWEPKSKSNRAINQ